MSNEANTLIEITEFQIGANSETVELNWGDSLPGTSDLVYIDGVPHNVSHYSYYYSRRLNNRLELARMEVHLDRT